jgi:hypothetical protein
VNLTNGKESPTLDKLYEIYPKQSMEKEIKDLYSMFQLALNKRQLKAEDIARWKLAVGRLRAMYGI